MLRKILILILLSINLHTTGNSINNQAKASMLAAVIGLGVAALTVKLLNDQTEDTGSNLKAENKRTIRAITLLGGVFIFFFTAILLYPIANDIMDCYFPTIEQIAEKESRIIAVTKCLEMLKAEENLINCLLNSSKNLEKIPSGLPMHCKEEALKYSRVLGNEALTVTTETFNAYY